MTSANFVYVSDKTYTRKEITKMEHDICNVLKFRFYEHVTPLHFIHRFFRASDVSFHQHHESAGDETAIDNNANSHVQGINWGSNPVYQFMTEYILELALLKPRFVGMKASKVAAAALYLARATLGLRDSNGNIWNETLSFYTTYEAGDLGMSILYFAYVLVSVFFLFKNK